MPVVSAALARAGRKAVWGSANVGTGFLRLLPQMLSLHLLRPCASVCRCVLLCGYMRPTHWVVPLCPALEGVEGPGEEKCRCSLRLLLRRFNSS